MASTSLSFASPVRPVGTSLPWARTSPDSRSRSSRGSSNDSEEPRDDGWVDEDLRSGGPVLAPSPCTTVSLEHRSPYVCTLDARTEMSKRVRAILKQSNVAVKAFTLCYRQCLLFLDAELVPTLLDEILGQICDSINCSSVLSIECFRFGESLDDDKNPTTIVITVDRRSDGSWKSAREAIVSILSRHNLHHVAVLIGQGQIYRGVDILDRRLPPDNAWEHEMQVGLSLGIYQFGHSSSTFGGWIELKQEEGSAWKKLGLTCFNCVLPNLDELSEADQIAIHKTFLKGISINDPLGKRLFRLEQPSLKDATPALDKLAEEVNEVPPHWFTAIKEAIREGGDVSPNWRKNYDQNMARLAVASKKMANIQQFHKPPTSFPSCLPSDDLLSSFLPINPRMESLESHSPSYAGCVFAASGYRQAISTIRREKRQVSWALIEVPESRHSQNNLSTYATDSGVYFSILQPFPGIPEENTKVIKLGRSTRRTKGYFSGLRSAHLNVPDGKDGMSQVETLEYAVIGASVSPFSDPGDSGALVFDTSANCIGMIFAGNTLTKTAYVTLLPDLFDDIKFITGAIAVRIAH
ncbi:uncharacterized protein GIQ15_01217 [Arthroderma uncinatum]|uniref:uncharacterized protein n=1 Tax=Arthroderma uncinatum TaxID=74035 RepID=UPI00144AF04B|nr:uncharacterized protein GIQ15_01217 [Arthroderma uncinatum]KAF3491700.1 hypothetical protein GIQ15_01217 [Arthroderma uncinatum]